MTFGKIFSLLLLSSLLTICGCGKSKKQSDAISSLSPKALAAKYYIDNELPEDQKQAFYTGHGDEANLYANLMNDGHLDGAAEYAEALLKNSNNKKE